MTVRIQQQIAFRSNCGPHSLSPLHSQRSHLIKFGGIRTDWRHVIPGSELDGIKPGPYCLAGACSEAFGTSLLGGPVDVRVVPDSVLQRTAEEVTAWHSQSLA